MTKYRAQEIFTPGSFPTHTYVERSDQAAETKLRDALSVPGQIVSLSGPSKSGKTVLVERVVGIDNLISIAGSLLYRNGDLWGRALDWMGFPSTVQKSDESGRTLWPQNPTVL